ncbi:hypothetical protein M9H77_30242 [Catharanthus roseus]|uniref:Uncharacterized protein n=1 Tax=Catharanthus roseus TaxID=4058 RepID=A0ACB9ZXQ9_CATRO|nr:hypothetical protein M9H77_30242 [Catharanthus roseus]
MCHLATEIENQKKRIGFSKTNLPSSRNVGPKPQASIYKSWPKKKDTPKAAFKDHSKPKVEEKGMLITNLSWCLKCNGVGLIAINCPAKRTLVFSEDLNGWIEKSDYDCQKGIVDKDKSSFNHQHRKEPKHLNAWVYRAFFFICSSLEVEA